MNMKPNFCILNLSISYFSDDFSNHKGMQKYHIWSKAANKIIGCYIPTCNMLFKEPPLIYIVCVTWKRHILTFYKKASFNMYSSLTTLVKNETHESFECKTYSFHRLHILSSSIIVSFLSFVHWFSFSFVRFLFIKIGLILHKLKDRIKCTLNTYI